jgi:hypothetical protein
MVATLVDGAKHEADLEDMYYVLYIHTWLLSMEKLESQGWMVPGA